MDMRLPIVLLVLTSATPAFAAPGDLVLTFRPNLLQRYIGDALVDEVNTVIDQTWREWDPGLPALSTQLESFTLRRASDRALGVTARVSSRPRAGGSSDVLYTDLQFEIRFRCAASFVDANFVLLSLSVGGFGIGFDIETRVNQQIDRVLARVREEMLRALDLPSSLRCPQVTVANDGTVTISFDFSPPECRNGQTRQRACGYNEWGDGRTYVCRNYRWVETGGLCISCKDLQHPDCPRIRP